MTSTLTLSARDAQFLVVLQSTYAAYIHALVSGDDRPLDRNEDARDRLFLTHYSPDEANALAERVRALLPADSVLIFATPSGARYAH